MARCPTRRWKCSISIQKDGKHLLGLINDVLDISKIDAGQLKLSLDDYSLQGIVDTVVASTGSLARAKALEIKTDIPPDLPVGRGDGRRLTQVLLNIVGNAIKFTDAGSIEIRAKAVNGHFNIAVKDTGTWHSARGSGPHFRGVPAG